jgi:hypothetical protein
MAWGAEAPRVKTMRNRVSFGRVARFFIQRLANQCVATATARDTGVGSSLKECMAAVHDSHRGLWIRWKAGTPGPDPSRQRPSPWPRARLAHAFFRPAR